jgi:hypothetical protein
MKKIFSLFSQIFLLKKCLVNKQKIKKKLIDNRNPENPRRSPIQVLTGLNVGDRNLSHSLIIGTKTPFAQHHTGFGTGISTSSAHPYQASKRPRTTTTSKIPEPSIIAESAGLFKATDKHDQMSVSIPVSFGSNLLPASY